MNPPWTLLVTSLVLVVGTTLTCLLACLRDLGKDEIRGRLDRLPQSLLRLAAMRLPAAVRVVLYAEWSAELHEILRGVQAVPVTRLVIGTRFAVGLLRKSHLIGQELAVVPAIGKTRPGVGSCLTKWSGW